MRFYKAAANTGTHIGNLWRADRHAAGDGHLHHETATGWQTVTFATPVSVTAGTTYVASYFTPTGHYAVHQQRLPFGFDTPRCTRWPTASAPNGVYAHGTTSAFPANSYNATNYWVDVLFAPLTS